MKRRKAAWGKRSGMRPANLPTYGYRRATELFLIRVALDETVSYRLLAEELYTLNQAEFKTYQIVVQRARGGLGVVHLSTPRLGFISRAPRLYIGSVS